MAIRDGKVSAFFQIRRPIVVVIDERRETRLDRTNFDTMLQRRKRYIRKRRSNKEICVYLTVADTFRRFRTSYRLASIEDVKMITVK